VLFDFINNIIISNLNSEMKQQLNSGTNVAKNYQ